MVDNLNNYNSVLQMLSRPLKDEVIFKPNLIWFIAVQAQSIDIKLIQIWNSPIHIMPIKKSLKTCLPKESNRSHWKLAAAEHSKGEEESLPT